jgi:uncharacterized protein YdbL (DUF1318 family)
MIQRACTILMTFAMLAMLVPVASGQVTRESLQKRFEQRYPQLIKLKEAGRVGETHDGLVAAVLAPFRDDRDIRAFIEQENEDRRQLYELLRDDLRRRSPPEERAKITAEVVARRNAKREFEKADAGEWLLVTESTWIQKRELPRYEKLLELKKEGKVGETWGGYVEAVRPEYASEPAIAQLIKKDNEVRLKRYEELAESRDRSEAEVAREHAEGYFKAAEPRHFLKTQDGHWIQRKDLPR